MTHLQRILVAAVSACHSWSPGPTMAEPGAGCWRDALAHLQASASDGFAIYEQAGDPEAFKGWIRCDDAQFDLPTAVHETTHVITGETDAFPLVGGGTVPLPHEVSRFFPPNRIAGHFSADDFTTIYLRLGKASSSTDFLYLLDELNAYSHDLAAAVALRHLGDPDVSVDHRDGLAALMAFVATYAEDARARDAATWAGLRQPRVAATIRALWGRAERVMASSCGIPRFGSLDKAYLRRVCAAPARTAMTPILGRAPVCPTACLAPRPADTADADPAYAGADRHSTAGPAWIRAVIRSKLAAPTRATDEIDPVDVQR